MKKLFALVLVLALAMSLTSTAFAAYEVNPDLANSETTLTVFGPGAFTSGSEDTTDLISGRTKPGYHVVVERWNELYPNVKLDIQEQPWDSWQTAITTACLSGDVDVIMHGATMTELTEDLTPYLEADPDYRNQINALASRRTADNPGQWKVSGISLTVSPMVVWLDTQIFADYGVDLPTEDWTFADLEVLAEKLTGTDPVTGNQTYGLQMDAMGENNLWFNYVLVANTYGAEVFTYGETLGDCVVNYLSDESIAAFETLQRLAAFVSPEAKEGLAVSTSLDGTNNWAMWFNEGTSPYFEMEANGMLGRYVAINCPICTAGQYEGKPSPHAGDNNMAIYKDAKDKELAWEFIKFMTTDEAMVQWVADQGSLPNNKEGFDAVSALIDKQYASAYFVCLNNIPDNYNNATNSVMNNVAFGATTANLITAVSNVIQGFSTPEEAAQLMQNGVDEYLASLN